MKTKKLVISSLFTALICISAVINIPLVFTPISVTLQVFAISVCASVLGKKYGCISVIIYELIGFMGFPVFSGFRGGPQVLFGATGGYIIGFIPAAFIIGYLTEKLYNANDKSLLKYIKITIPMLLGLLLVYLFGTIQFMIVGNVTFVYALSMAVIPFVLFDLIKIALATAVTCFLKSHINILMLEIK